MMRQEVDKLNRIIKKQSGQYIRPRDAATLILLDRQGSEPRILMGCRHHGSAFMPNKYVFPGGRISPSDSRVRAASPMDPVTLTKLLHEMKGKPSEARARGLMMGAIRETFEETGIALGCANTGGLGSRAPEWRDYYASGLAPALDKLRYFARAITPPGRTRRFDARFFIADAADLGCDSSSCISGDGELKDLSWLTIGEAIDSDIPAITETILRELEARMKAADWWSPAFPVPFYQFRHNRFVREVI